MCQQCNQQAAPAPAPKALTPAGIVDAFDGINAAAASLCNVSVTPV